MSLKSSLQGRIFELSLSIILGLLLGVVVLDWLQFKPDELELRSVEGDLRLVDATRQILFDESFDAAILEGRSVERLLYDCNSLSQRNLKPWVERANEHLSSTLAKPSLDLLGMSQKIFFGEKARVYLNSSLAGTTQLILKDENDELVLVTELAAGLQTIEWLPLFSGPLNFSLWQKTGEDSQEELLFRFGVEVVPPAQGQVALLASSPSFEFRFLKNWLEAGGHQVQFKYAMQAKRSLEDVINSDEGKSQQNRLNLLDPRQVDVLIADINALSSVAQKQLESIQEAVDKGELALILMAKGVEDFKANSRRLAPFVKLSQVNNSELTLENLAKTLVFRTDSGEELREQVLDSLELSIDVSSPKIPYILGNHESWPKSTLGISTVLESYKLQLSGKQQLYALYWQKMLESVWPSTKKPLTSFIWPPNPNPKTLTLACMESEAAINDNDVKLLPPGKISSSSPIADPDYKLRCVYLAPEQTGWHRLVIAGESLNFYVSPAELMSNCGTEIETLQLNSFLRDSGDQRQTLTLPLSKQTAFLAILGLSSICWILGFLRRLS